MMSEKAFYHVYIACLQTQFFLLQEMHKQQRDAHVVPVGEVPTN